MQVTSSAAKERMKAVMKQVSSLSTSLPIHYASSIHVAVDTDRMDVLRVLILPDAATPYGNGAFLFDALLPATYPAQPPKVLSSQ